MSNIQNQLKADEHNRNASYSNGKADLCGDLLQEFKDLSDEMRNRLYAIQHIERTTSIKELETCIELINKKEGN